MTDRARSASPQVYARVGGLLCLIIIVAGLFGEAFALCETANARAMSYGRARRCPPRLTRRAPPVQPLWAEGVPEAGSQP